MSRQHWDYNVARPNYTVTGNPDVVVTRPRVVDQHSRWNRLLTPLAKVFRFNYFWMWDDERNRRRVWIGRVR